MPSIRNHFLIYLVFPLGLSLTMIIMFYSGNSTLQSIIVPTIPSMDIKSAREFGLLENIQHFYIMMICVICAIGIKRHHLLWQKAGLGACLSISIFVLLEEIDYGLHYYEFIKGVPKTEIAQTRNIHNLGSGDLLQNIRRVIDFLMALLFLIAPFTLGRSRFRFGRYIAPSRWLLLTALGMIALSEFAHLLNERDSIAYQGVLGKNVSEFRETTIYYMFMIYLWDLVFWRKWAAPSTENQAL